MDIFKTLLKEADSEYGALVEDGVESADVKFWIDTGSYSLNALLSGTIYGGFAGNKRLVLAGKPATGKTFYTLALVKNFLTQHPNGFVFYFESESAISKQMIVDRGIPTDRIAIMPVVSVQDFATQATRIVDKYRASGGTYETNPMMFCLDSLGNLSTNKELEDIAKGNGTKDMTRAGLIKAAFRVLTLKLGINHVSLISTNHIYANVGGYGPIEKMGGGSGAEYAGDQICWLSKSKDAEGEGKKKVVSGIIVKVLLYKSRLTIQDKWVETYLDFHTSLDRYYGLYDLAMKFGIFKKEGNYTVIPDGRKLYQAAIEKTPEVYFTKEILDQIDEACKAEFLYGKTNVIETEEIYHGNDNRGSNGEPTTGTGNKFRSKQPKS